MDAQRSFDEYRMPDKLWEQMQHLLPDYRPSRKGGRPRTDLRSIADAIFYRLRTGCQWKAIPPELAPGSTAHDYYQEWAEWGIFDKLWNLAVEVYADLIGLDWRWQAVDGAMTKAPLGGEKTGKNPTDRGKLGSKRSVQTDAAGIPVGLAVAGANVPDGKLLQETIEDCIERAVDHDSDEDEHLCLDKGYDYPDVHQFVEQERYVAHIKHRRRRGEPHIEACPIPGETQFPARRWVVERTLGWLAKRRSLRTRWCKKSENWLALVQFACAHILMNFAIYG